MIPARLLLMLPRGHGHAALAVALVAPGCVEISDLAATKIKATDAAVHRVDTEDVAVGRVALADRAC